MDTIDEFLSWFGDGLRYLGQLLSDTVCQAGNMILNIFAWVIVLVIAILLSPIWVLPFIYWYFVERKKKEVNRDNRKV